MDGMEAEYGIQSIVAQYNIVKWFMNDISDKEIFGNFSQTI